MYLELPRLTRAPHLCRDRGYCDDNGLYGEVPSKVRRCQRIERAVAVRGRLPSRMVWP
jgi:hypothetical protein